MRWCDDGAVCRGEATVNAFLFTFRDVVSFTSVSLIYFFNFFS